MKRHVSIAISAGQRHHRRVCAAPQPKPQAGPLVDSSRLLLQIEQTHPREPRALWGPRLTGHVCQPRDIAPNIKNRPHYNDQDQIVTVLKGTWWVGKGEAFRQDKLVAVREGGLMILPAKLAYYDVAGSGDVILQISGVGPGQVDARGTGCRGQSRYAAVWSISGGHAGRRRPAPPLRASSPGRDNLDPDNPDPAAGDADTTAGSGQSRPAAGNADAKPKYRPLVD